MNSIFTWIALGAGVGALLLIAMSGLKAAAPALVIVAIAFMLALNRSEKEDKKRRKQ